MTTLTGSLSDVADAYASSGSGTGNAYTLTVTGTTATAINLNKVDAVTTIAVDVSAITTVTGALSDVATAYASAGLSGLGNEAVTLSDTTVAAAALNALDLLTSGTISASTVTTVTGAADAVALVYASSGISGLGNEAVTLAAGTVAAGDLNAIDTATSGAIDASAVTTVTGSLSDVADAYASSGISLDGDESVTLDDLMVAAAALNALDLLTSGTIDATTVTTVTGSLSDVADAYASSGISDLGEESVTLDDLTVAAADPRRRHPRPPRPQRPQAHFKRRLHAQSRRQSRPA